jgi:peptide/nickel transport system permease protein
MAVTTEDTARRQEALEIWSGTKSKSFFAPLLDTFRLLVHDGFALVGIIIIGLFLLAAIFADLLAPYDPFQTLKTAEGGLARLQPPSAEHWLGTTAFAKDVLSQLLIGTRVAFIVGVSAAVVVGFVSTLLGLLSGYYGRYVDDAIMRMTDFALSIPTLPIAIVAVAILGPSLRNIIIVIALLFWRNGARIVRSVVLTEKEKVYVQAARAAGASHTYIMLVHILPNVIPVAFLWMTMSIAFAVLAEASLSFLGLGDPNTTSWGQMLNIAFSTGSIRTAWWWVLPPSLCLVALISSIYVVGRAYEEKTNPRLRRS